MFHKDVSNKMRIRDSILNKEGKGDSVTGDMLKWEILANFFQRLSVGSNTVVPAGATDI